MPGPGYCFPSSLPSHLGHCQRSPIYGARSSSALATDFLGKSFHLPFCLHDQIKGNSQRVWEGVQTSCIGRGNGHDFQKSLVKLPPATHSPPSSTIKPNNPQGTATSVESRYWQPACSKLSAWREKCFQEISLSLSLSSPNSSEQTRQTAGEGKSCQLVGGKRGTALQERRGEEGGRGFERLGSIPSSAMVWAG